MPCTELQVGDVLELTERYFDLEPGTVLIVYCANKSGIGDFRARPLWKSVYYDTGYCFVKDTRRAKVITHIKEDL